MGNTNPTMSEIKLCSHIVVKLGMNMEKQKTRNRNPKETLTTSPTMTVEKKYNMQGTMSALHRQKNK